MERPHREGEEVAEAEALLRLGEETLEHWIVARDMEPVTDKREGFRLLALHRQGATGDPSFNACRETCRELVYHYNLLPQNTKWDFKVGGALSSQRTVIELATTEDPPATSGRVEDWVFLPLLSLDGRYNIRNNMALVAEGNWISTSNDDHLDATISFNYLFDRHWDAGIGYGEYRRTIDTSELFNSVKYNLVTLNVGYTF